MLFLPSFMDGARSGILFCVRSVNARCLFLSHHFLLWGAFPVFLCTVPGEGREEGTASGGRMGCVSSVEVCLELCVISPSRCGYVGDVSAVRGLGSFPLPPRVR